MRPARAWLSTSGFGHRVDDEVEPGPVEDVIATAVALVSGRLAPREAVTIPAILAPSLLPRPRRHHVLPRLGPALHLRHPAHRLDRS